MPDDPRFSGFGFGPAFGAAFGWRDPVRFVEHQWLLGQKASPRPIAGLGSVLGSVPTAMGRIEAAQRAIDRSEEISGAFSRTGHFVGTLGEGLGSGLASILGKPRIASGAASALGGSALRALRGLPEAWNLGGAFRSAVGVAAGELIRAFEEASLGDEVLLEADFGFSDVLWTIAYRRSLARTNVRPDSPNAQAVVTNRLLSVTRSEEFLDDVAETFSGSPFLSKRWRVVEPALGAHLDRDYALSVPVLMAQVEGALADMMMLKDLVVKEGGRYYQAGADGRPKTGRDGKRVREVTLGSVKANAQLREGTELGGAAEFIADSLVTRRNEVLHGHDTAYGRAKLSVQALLILTVVAEAVARLEEE